MKNYKIYQVLLASILLVFTACKKSEHTDPTPTVVTETGSVSFYFDTQTLNGSVSTKLNLDNSGITDSTTALTNSYTDANGDMITINKVRYWVSNIVLTDSLGNTFTEPNSYHLIEYTPTSAIESFDISGVPLGSYTKIKFSIGVDPETNHSIAKTSGDLSQTIGMSWSWNTGYIFLLMEGRYEKSADKFGYYYLHIGTDDNYKTLTFDLPENAVVVKEGAPELHFSNNFLGVFGTSIDGSSIIDLKEGDTVMSGSDLATNIANNYGLANAVFTLNHVHQAGEE